MVTLARVLMPSTKPAAAERATTAKASYIVLRGSYRLAKLLEGKRLRGRPASLEQPKSCLSFGCSGAARARLKRTSTFNWASNAPIGASGIANTWPRYNCHAATGTKSCWTLPPCGGFFSACHAEEIRSSLWSQEAWRQRSGGKGLQNRNNGFQTIDAFIGTTHKRIAD